MDYSMHYNKLVETRKNRVKEEGVYYERHHILPVSMGGTNDESNLVHLTAREHFLAHWLLWKIHRNRETAAAFSCMTKLLLKRNKYTPSSRLFEKARIASSEFAKIHISKRNTVYWSTLSLDERRKCTKKMRKIIGTPESGVMKRWHFDNCKLI